MVTRVASLGLNENQSSFLAKIKPETPKKAKLDPLKYERKKERKNSKPNSRSKPRSSCCHSQYNPSFEKFDKQKFWL